MLFFIHGICGSLSHVPNEMHTDKNTKHGEPKMQYKSLSKSNQSILNICRELRYGSVTSLKVKDGEIHATEATRKCQSILFSRPSEAAKARADGDFTLSANQENLVLAARRLGEAVILRLEVQNGQPVQANIEEAIPAF